MIVIGTDIVHIPGFAEQLHTPGSRWPATVFSPLELRAAGRKPAGKQRDEHLAGRWAAKEAFIKAWGQALYGRPPVLPPDSVDLREIEIHPDAYGRVKVVYMGQVARAVEQSLGAGRFQPPQLSISHDGDYALAQCLWEVAITGTLQTATPFSRRR